MEEELKVTEVVRGSPASELSVEAVVSVGDKERPGRKAPSPVATIPLTRM